MSCTRADILDGSNQPDFERVQLLFGVADGRVVLLDAVRLGADGRFLGIIPLNSRPLNGRSQYGFVDSLAGFGCPDGQYLVQIEDPVAV